MVKAVRNLFQTMKSHPGAEDLRIGKGASGEILQTFFRFWKRYRINKFRCLTDLRQLEKLSR